MDVYLDPRRLEDYRTFLAIKQLPVYSFCGRTAWFPDEYAHRLGLDVKTKARLVYTPQSFVFDYQRDITEIALKKQKYALFIDCGLGKTIIYFEYLRTVRNMIPNHGCLILSPLMVIDQTVAECEGWYGDDIQLDVVKPSRLNQWLSSCAGKIGITNFEALKADVRPGQLGCLVVDESSIIKSHYGKYGQQILKLGRGLDWKLAGTGTPAPNDRIEYANHAVFLDHFPTVNSFLAKYFVNRGQTQERWVIKPHALEPFYRSISHWSIFMSNPATYGWKDNCESIPPIHVHIDDVPMTDEQHHAVRNETRCLFAVNPGGITTRAKFSKIAKGLDGSKTRKYEYIQSLIASWPDESTIVWCWYNDEQSLLEKALPDAGSIQGSTKHADRMRIIDDFKAGRCKILISKPKVLGFGLNLQIATRQVFSSLIDSYELYYQAVKRSNRYGSTKPLNVHIPVLDVERPMVENVLRKSRMVQHDTDEQERIFKTYGYTA